MRLADAIRLGIFTTFFTVVFQPRDFFTMSSLTIRRWHSYVGLFIAPSVLFFALTGATQIYGLHEAHAGYEPPLILEKLGSVHKDQVFALSHHDAPAAPKAGDQSDAATASPPEAAGDDEPSLSTRILKGFFLVVALGLSLSTGFGLWMGLTQTRQKRLAWVLLISGALIPVVLASL